MLAFARRVKIFSSLKITFCKNGDAKRKSTQFYFKISIILKFEYFTEMYAYQTNIYVRVLKTRQIHEFTNYKKNKFRNNCIGQLFYFQQKANIFYFIIFAEICSFFAQQLVNFFILFIHLQVHIFDLVIHIVQYFILRFDLTSQIGGKKFQT